MGGPDPEHPSEDEAGASARLLSLIEGAWPTQVLATAARLELADHLRHGPLRVDDLAEALAVPSAPLKRLLRALCTLGVCREREDGAFHLTPRGELLAADHPRSLRATALWWGEHLWPLWGSLPEVVRSGRSARQLRLGTEGFDHLEEDPAATALFHRFGWELTRASVPRLLGAYVFPSHGRVVDVGAGSGALLAGILESCPGCEGVYFDRPAAVAEARSRPDLASLAPRCRFEAGDFFREVPAEGDVYLLKAILHDWDDAAAARILAVLRRTMPARADLLVIEQLMPPRLNEGEGASVVCSDLTMLVAHSGRERSLEEFEALLKGAGFRLERHVRWPQGPALLHAVPRMA